jgi:hypothetical protein
VYSQHPDYSKWLARKRKIISEEPVVKEKQN